MATGAQELPASALIFIVVTGSNVGFFFRLKKDSHYENESTTACNSFLLPFP